MPPKQEKPGSGWGRVLGFRLSAEQEEAVDEAIKRYRARTRENITLSDIAKNHGAAAFVRSEGLAWPEKRAERP